MWLKHTKQLLYLNWKKWPEKLQAFLSYSTEHKALGNNSGEEYEDLEVKVREESEI